MQISLKWINELVNIEKIDLNDLIEKLTLGGFEVEEILKLPDGHEIALEISTTANRSDSLSIHGLSTEIAALLDKQLAVSPYSFQKFDWKEKIANSSTLTSIEDNCSTFVAVTVENLTNISVPKWLKEKLIYSGFTPLNNLLDFQNYILLETGYPFAFYDYAKICSTLNCSELNFSVTPGKNSTEFLAANNSIYQLDNSVLVVEINETPISIGGLIESNEFAYSETTSSLIIEASIFDAAKIRQQSRNLGLRTDRSARYEKSLKNSYLNEALYKLISLLRISNPNLNCKFRTIFQKKEELSKLLILRHQTIKEILGPVETSSQINREYVRAEEITDYLKRLQFTFSYDELTSLWKVEIPHSRSDDLTREIDLVEEIGRLHGFNHFLITLPKIKIIGNEDSSYKTRKKITSCLLNLGLSELIHYSFASEKEFLTNDIKLINPLLSDSSHLRSSLLPDLVKTMQGNVKQGNLIVEGFEYGHIFLTSEGESFQETEYIAGIFGGIKTKLDWSGSSLSLTWFEAKGKIEQLFKQLNLLTYWKTSNYNTTNTVLHPFRSAELYLSDGKRLGIFGQLHPILSNRLNISSSTYLFEFDFELIKSKIQQNQLVVYKDYSSYPKIVKDVSFMINRAISFSQLKKTLYCNGTKFLSKINLLDEYRSDSMPIDQTSLCLQFIFQSNEKTLQNKEIESIVSNLQNLLSTKFDAVIRK